MQIENCRTILYLLCKIFWELLGSLDLFHFIVFKLWFFLYQRHMASILFSLFSKQSLNMTIKLWFISEAKDVNALDKLELKAYLYIR